MREISPHILDIAENSIRAGAPDVEIGVRVDEPADRLVVTVRDNGRGMPEEMAAVVADPFVTSRTERRVGLGLPLLAAACERTGGGLKVRSRPGEGTEVEATFGLSSVDRAPMGALAETIANIASGYPDVRIALAFSSGGEQFEFDSALVREALDGVPLSSPQVAAWMREHIQEGIAGVSSLE